MWRHKKEKHINVKTSPPIEVTDENKFKICKYCNKEFSNANHRWRHEKHNCKKHPDRINSRQQTNNKNIQTQNNIYNITLPVFY